MSSPSISLYFAGFLAYIHFQKISLAYGYALFSRFYAAKAILMMANHCVVFLQSLV